MIGVLHGKFALLYDPCRTRLCRDRSAAKRAR
jgi:hypothetical protein